jgi:DNA-directed RNA polymerase subunit beta
LNKFQSSSLFPLQSETPEKVQVYLVEKRKIQVGDKMSGRHGNKGIVSQILPIPDMPFLPDGTPLDMVLNPLGVPSRMNVGQIYECILGLASKYLQQYYRIQPFDEIYGPQASRSFTFSKLYEARQKTSQKWLFNPCYPGKIQIFDGRTGEPYENPVTVGISYILKLVHLVDDKIHARSTGPYSLVTQQPLKGRSKYGGQRLGEMEVWAIEAYGAAFVLLEMLTIKSDDISGRMTLWSNILLNMPIYIGTPESFKVLVCELQALCLDMGLYKLNKKGFLTQIEHLMQLP